MITLLRERVSDPPITFCAACMVKSPPEQGPTAVFKKGKV